MIDDDENLSTTRTENLIFEVSKALDGAGTPRTDTERDGVGINLELTLPDRVQWLVERLKDAHDQLMTTNQVLRNHGAPMDELTTGQGATWVGRELTAQCRRGDEAESHLSELHIKLRQLFDAESVAEALEEAATLKTKRDEVTKERDWIKKSRDAEYTEFKVKLGELTMKIEQLEVRKFATTADLVRVQQKADVVVDLVSGSVVKNRFGKRSSVKSKAKRPSTKPKPKARKR